MDGRPHGEGDQVRIAAGQIAFGLCRLNAGLQEHQRCHAGIVGEGVGHGGNGGRWREHQPVKRRVVGREPQIGQSAKAQPRHRVPAACDRDGKLGVEQSREPGIMHRAQQCIAVAEVIIQCRRTAPDGGGHLGHGHGLRLPALKQPDGFRHRPIGDVDRLILARSRHLALRDLLNDIKLILFSKSRQAFRRL